MLYSATFLKIFKLVVQFQNSKQLILLERQKKDLKYDLIKFYPIHYVAWQRTKYVQEKDKSKLIL